ncbi:MAG: hypothetical protein QMB94_08610, partial [Phycisphaerales bacterium]
VSDSGSLGGTSYQMAGDWLGVSIFRRADLPITEWTFDSTSVVDLDGVVIAPSDNITLSGSSRFDAGGAVVRQFIAADMSTSTFSDAFIISPNATAGRARLVD